MIDLESFTIYDSYFPVTYFEIGILFLVLRHKPKYNDKHNCVTRSETFVLI